ncbi:MAG: putative 4-hydroxybenzoate polyprenyltransferase [Bacteroidetes bacterium]|nr:putative 4-hydroxybenzoate polyprenyltransferase [Bacteroidota bacterium]
MKDYLSLIKFSHTIFALPFAIIGFFLAVFVHGYELNWTIFFLMILCMVFARSAAMAFNRYIDRDIDVKNPRTAIREIPAGTIAAKKALWFVVLNAALFITCTFFINPLCFYLSPVALLVVLGYSYTKRFTALCHLVLGLGLALAPIGAYLAVSGQFHWLSIFFSLIVFLWVSGFDIIYALQDADFDKSNDLHSIPSTLGIKDALKVSVLIHLLCALLVIAAGFYAQFQMFYWIGALAFIALLTYQHTLVKPNDLSKVNIAFFTSNGVASIVFAIFVLLELIVIL